MARSSGQRLLGFDRKLGVRYVAGADEAGRGSLAGPLVVAGVLLDYETLRGARVRPLAGLNDSKQVAVVEREVALRGGRQLRDGDQRPDRVGRDDRPRRAAPLEPRRAQSRSRRPPSSRRGLPRRRLPARADGAAAPGRRRRGRSQRCNRRGVDRREGRARPRDAAPRCPLPALRVSLARRLHHPGTYGGRARVRAVATSTAARSRPRATARRRRAGT